MISWPIAKATMRERGAQPVAVATVLVLLLVASYNHNPFGGFAQGWTVLFTLILGGGLISAEVESGHAQLVLLRPLTRAAFVGGRLAGAAILLAGAMTLAWLAAFARGGPGLYQLPLALLPALGWLATLTAVSTVTPGWSNAAWLIGAKVGWFFFRYTVPLITKRPDVAAALEAIDAHFGPQELLSAKPSLIVYDAFWLSGAWLLGCVLFKDRELARRRA